MADIHPIAILLAAYHRATQTGRPVLAYAISYLTHGEQVYAVYFRGKAERSSVDALPPSPITRSASIAALVHQELGESYSGFYRKGMKAALGQAFYGEYITNPYPCGTAESDAFKFGIERGTDVARRVQAEAM